MVSAVYKNEYSEKAATQMQGIPNAPETSHARCGEKNNNFVVGRGLDMMHQQVFQRAQLLLKWYQDVALFYLLIGCRVLLANTVDVDSIRTKYQVFD